MCCTRMRRSDARAGTVAARTLWVVPSTFHISWSFIALAALSGGKARAQNQVRLEDIQNAIAAQRSNIRAIAVSVTQRSIGLPGTTQNFQHHEFAMLGRQYFMEHEYANDGGSFLVACTFDGGLGLTYTAKTRIAALRGSVDPVNFSTMGSGFFDLLMYYPSVDGLDAPLGPVDLLTLLENERSTIKSSAVDLNDTRCILVEVQRENGAPSDQIWIDPARGFYPLRHDCLNASGQLLVSYETTSLAEIDGVWLPLEGLRRAPPSDMNPGPIETVISVDLDAMGRPLASMNANIPPGKFSYLNQLPPGTMIAAANGEILETVSEERFDANSKIAIALADIRSQPSEPQQKANGPIDPNYSPRRPVPEDSSASPSHITPTYAPTLTDRRYLATGIVLATLAFIACAMWLLIMRRR